MTSEIDYPREYDNSGRVEDSETLINNYILDAALHRERPDIVADYDLSYGPEERNRLDIFWPSTDEGRAKKSPIVVFIHGGYWQYLDRSSFSHMAEGLNKNDIAVAIPSYTLCPDIDIEGIIREMRRACLILYKTYRKNLTVIGHSAGGHLAACMLATDWRLLHESLPSDLVASGLGISGLYDLLPLLKTPINDAVRMDEAQATAASPVLWIPQPLQKFDAWVGSDESSEYHRQSRDLANRWSMLGTPTTYVREPDTNHFTIIDALTQSESPMVKRIVELVETPMLEVELTEPDEAAIEAILNPKQDQLVEENQGVQKDEPDVKAEKKTTDKPKRKVTKNKRVIMRKAQPKASIAGKAPPSARRKKPKKNNKSEQTKATSEQ